jgi:hypothetical protein
MRVGRLPAAKIYLSSLGITLSKLLTTQEDRYSTYQRNEGQHSCVGKGVSGGERKSSLPDQKEG